MVYLAILVFAAAVGLLRLWLQQRRERRNLEPGSLRRSLERLSERPVPVAPPHSGGSRSLGGGARSHNRIPHGGRAAAQGPTSPRREGRFAARPEPLEPTRREAARRRIEARRAARTRATG